MATVDYAHIALNADNEATIVNARTKVRMVVMDYLANGWDAEEIQRQHPYLSLGQIHSALGYYHDHKAEMDAEIARDIDETDRLMEEIDRRQNTSALRAKLNAGQDA